MGPGSIGGIMNDSAAPDRRLAGRTSARLSAVLGMVLILAYALGALIQRHFSLGNTPDDLKVIGLDWIVVLVLAILGFGFQHRDAGFFGLRVPRWRDFLILIAWFVVTGMLVVGLSAIPPIHRALLALPNQHVANVPFVLRLGLVLTVAICEEVIFRGYLIEQIRAWTGSIGIGAWMSLILFTLPHAWYYGFTWALVIPALIGGSLILLYVLRRNLPICMLMHAMVDGYFLLLVPALAGLHGG